MVYKDAYEAGRIEERVLSCWRQRKVSRISTD